MKKQLGFTLVEVLAVIFILGILALITTPTVSTITTKAKKKAYENTVNNFIETVNNYAIFNAVTEDRIKDGVYRPKDLKDVLELENKDNLDELNGWIEIKENEIQSYNFINGDTIIRNNRKAKETKKIEKLKTATMKNNFAYKEKYSEKILNVYVTFGTLPDTYIEKWNMNDEGTIHAFVVENQENNEFVDLYIVSEYKIIAPSTLNEMFYQCKNVKRIQFDNFDTSKVTTFYRMFKECQKLEYVNVENFNVSSAKSFSEMFYSCIILPEIDTSKWKNSVATSLSSTFNNCRKIKKIDLRGFTTKNLTTLGWIFSSTPNLTEVPGLESLYTANVTSFEGIFNYCGIKKIDVSKWNTAKGTTMRYMFASLINISEVDIRNFDTSNVTRMDYMFKGAHKLTKIYVGPKWSIEKVTIDTNMFLDSKKLVGAVSYNSSKIDKSMANTTTGYLTLKK